MLDKVVFKAILSIFRACAVALNRYPRVSPNWLSSFTLNRCQLLCFVKYTQSLLFVSFSHFVMSCIIEGFASQLTM